MSLMPTGRSQESMPLFSLAPQESFGLAMLVAGTAVLTVEIFDSIFSKRSPFPKKERKIPSSKGPASPNDLPNHARMRRNLFLDGVAGMCFGIAFLLQNNPEDKPSEATSTNAVPNGCSIDGKTCRVDSEDDSSDRKVSSAFERLKDYFSEMNRNWSELPLDRKISVLD